MDESSRLYIPLLSPEDLVRKYRYNPFRRGRYIRELKEAICNNELPDNISPNLLSVINDCLFPGDIEAILTQHTQQACLLATLITNDINLEEYPAIQKVAEKYQNGALLLHLAIEQRDVEAFRVQLNENNLMIKHPDLNVVPIDHLRHLIEQYKNNRGFKTPRQWWRNRKLQQMLEIYEAKKTFASTSLVIQDEHELEAYTPSYHDVFTPEEKPGNFSEEWVVDVFKKNFEVIDNLLTRCIEKNGWKVLFSAAMNPDLELNVEKRECLLKKVFAELDFLAPRAEAGSQLIKDFSKMYADAQLEPENKALLSNVFEQLNPVKLVDLMRRHDSAIEVLAVSDVQSVNACK